MKIRLTLFLLLSSLYSFSQEVQGTQHTVEPVGEYKEIKLTNDIEAVRLLADSTHTDKTEIIDSVEHSPDKYIPPVLYVLSYVLFNSDRKNEAAFWFYLAQLRARYDVNRCADKTANASEYNQKFGPDINKYATQNLDSLQVLITNVINFEKNHAENYDQRWINLTGMVAMSAGLGDKKALTKPLSLPQEQWAAIKEKTINDYMNGFNEVMAMLKKQRESK